MRNGSGVRAANSASDWSVYRSEFAGCAAAYSRSFPSSSRTRKKPPTSLRRAGGVEGFGEQLRNRVGAGLLPRRGLGKSLVDACRHVGTTAALQAA